MDSQRARGSAPVILWELPTVCLAWNLLIEGVCVRVRAVHRRAELPQIQLYTQQFPSVNPNMQKSRASTGTASLTFAMRQAVLRSPSGSILDGRGEKLSLATVCSLLRHPQPWHWS